MKTSQLCKQKLQQVYAVFAALTFSNCQQGEQNCQHSSFSVTETIRLPDYKRTFQKRKQPKNTKKAQGRLKNLPSATEIVLT